MTKKLVVLLKGEHGAGKSATWRALFKDTEKPSRKGGTAYNFVERLRCLLVKRGSGSDELGLFAYVLLFSKPKTGLKWNRAQVACYCFVLNATR